MRPFKKLLSSFLIALIAVPTFAQVIPVGGLTPRDGILVKEDNVSIGGSRTLNFTGSGVTTSISAGIVTVDISGADLSGYVPYTGATADVDLGDNNLFAEGLYSSNILSAGKSFSFQGVLDYPLSSNLDDFDTKGFSVVIFTPDSKGYSVTGVRPLYKNTVLVLYNDTPELDRNIVLTHEDAASAAKNRFELPEARLDLWSKEGVLFIYDLATSRWKYIGRYIPEINGNDNELLYKSGKDAQGATKLLVDVDTNLNVLPSTTETTPAAGATIFTDADIGRAMLGQVGVGGDKYRYAPFGGDRIIKQWVTQSGVTAVNLGLTIAFTGGTSSPVTVNTNYFTSQSQIWLNVAAAANSIAGGRHSGLLVNRGNGNNTGGFYWAFRGGGFDAAAVADARNFAGLWGTNGFMTNLNPSAQVNTLGFGWDSGDANMQFMHNDSAGVATKIDLGAGFPANTNNADWYKHEIWCYPTGSEVYYRLTRYTAAGVGTSVSGSVSTNIPVNNIYMSPQIFSGNGATALARRYAMGHMYLETNY